MSEPTDTKRSTRLEDLAAKAGVSISTASRALNDSPHVNRRTKQAIWKLAREMDYPFRGYMPLGPAGADATLALVVPRPPARATQLSDPFFFELFASIGQAARERGCDLVFSHTAPNSYEELVYALDTSRAEGVIFIGQSSLHSAFNQLMDHNRNFVVWGAQLPDQDYCSVGSDNELGGRRATSHLLRLGRKRIVFLGDQSAPEAFQRQKGYSDALQDAGLTRDAELVVSCQFTLEAGRTAVETLLARGLKFDAIFAASDLIGLGAMRALREAGLSVSGDVAVVGYDNVPFSQMSHPTLSTINQDVTRAGRTLVSKILDSDGFPGQSLRTPTDLIVRESCGG